MKFAVVGSGFSGAIVAHKLAEENYEVTVYESRSHIGGNCYTERDQDTGILIHTYGPHIFHTDDEEVWSFVNRFSEFVPYINRVKSTVKGEVYSLPINLHTINQFFNKALSPNEAKEFINRLGDSSIVKPRNFEEQALKFVGYDLYEAFFKWYTRKQWGVDPKHIPASILKRLPVRFNYDDNYFNHRYQGIPRNGYTPIFEKLLSSKNIQLLLNEKYDARESGRFDHVIYTGPLDAWFNYSIGRLKYRTLDFVKENLNGDYQGCAVMNYGDREVPFTRITEHKHFSPWEPNSRTTIYKEFSRECKSGDIPYYPLRLADDEQLVGDYMEIAKNEKRVSFLGRLGTYRYLDMDVTIKEAITASRIITECVLKGDPIPVFFNLDK